MGSNLEIRKIFRDSILLFILATIVIQWVYFIKVGGLYVKPVHISIILLSYLVIIDKNYRELLLPDTVAQRIFFLAYTWFLVVEAVSILWSDVNLSSGLTMLIRSSIYFLFFILIRALFLMMLKDGRDRLMLFSGFSGILFFIFLAYYIFKVQGRSFIVEYVLTFFGGNNIGMRYDIYHTLFNYQFFGESETSDEDMRVSIRNMMLVVFNMVFIMTFIHTARTNSKVLLYIVRSIIVFLIISSLSRSNLIMLILSIFVSVVISIPKQNLNPKIKYVKSMFLIGILLVSSVVIFKITPYLIPVVEMIQGRLVELAGDTRFDLFNSAMIGISDHVFFGNGYGSKVSLSHSRVADNHNLFLGAWFMSGIVGLLLTLVYYYSVLMEIILILSKNRYWNSNYPRNWVVAMATLPLFRTLISGNNGSFTMTDWTVLALFFAYSSHNLTFSKELQNKI